MRTVPEDIFVSFREEIMNIHAQKGLLGAKNYLYVNFKIKLKRKRNKETAGYKIRQQNAFKTTSTQGSMGIRRLERQEARCFSDRDKDKAVAGRIIEKWGETK